MEQIIDPIALYLICGLGAAGIALALPRRTPNGGRGLVITGAIVLAFAFGLAALLMGLRANDNGNPQPNFFFYPFALIALGSAIRVITHKRPVYSALYFIMTIIASCGLYLLLSAEFLAFALVIIYAGAILITYLFVIMLATQAPTGEDDSMLGEVDAESREPILASVIGFVLVGLLTAAMFSGVGRLPEPVMTQARAQDGVLAYLPGKADKVLARNGLLDGGWRVARDPETGMAVIDPDERISRIELIEGEDAHGEPLIVATRTLGPEDWPEELRANNLDRLGYNLLNDHPMMIEVAGIILLMAMLGATVLARKHVELEEDLKATQARRLGTMFPEDPHGVTESGGAS
ncbi:MAG: NADH-quinone oxidoreductase subunit J [Phycisphaerales bacterium]